MLAITGDLELWHLCVMAAVFGLGQAFAGPAFGSIVPQLVPDDLLVQANSALFTVNPLAFLFIGPALGGFTIAAAGTGAAFLLDATSFVIGALAIALIAARPAARILDEGERRTIVQDIRESVRYVRRRVWLWGTLTWELLVLPLAWGPYVVLLPFFVKNELGGDARAARARLRGRRRELGAGGAPDLAGRPAAPAHRLHVRGVRARGGRPRDLRADERAVAGDGRGVRRQLRLDRRNRHLEHARPAGRPRARSSAGCGASTGWPRPRSCPSRS